MHLVDILTDSHRNAEPAAALATRENPENRASQSAHKHPICLSAWAGNKAADSQDIEDSLLTRIAQAPEPHRSGALAFAPPLQEVIH